VLAVGVKCENMYANSQTAKEWYAANPRTPPTGTGFSFRALFFATGVLVALVTSILAGVDGLEV